MEVLDFDVEAVVECSAAFAIDLYKQIKEEDGDI
jgi:hypothetical protein